MCQREANWPPSGWSAQHVARVEVKLLWSSRQGTNRAYLHSIYCRVKERIHGETGHAISTKRCTCVDGWMNGSMAYSIKHWFSLVSSPFFRHGYPSLSFLSLFFWGHASLACHLFSFLGQPQSNTISYFRDVLKRESTKAQSIYWWMMMMLIPDVGMSQVDRDVYVLMIEKA